MLYQLNYEATHWKPWFFRPLLSNCLIWKIYCDALSLFTFILCLYLCCQWEGWMRRFIKMCQMMQLTAPAKRDTWSTLSPNEVGRFCIGPFILKLVYRACLNNSGQCIAMLIRFLWVGWGMRSALSVFRGRGRLLWILPYAGFLYNMKSNSKKSHRQ